MGTFTPKKNQATYNVLLNQDITIRPKRPDKTSMGHYALLDQVLTVNEGQKKQQRKNPRKLMQGGLPVEVSRNAYDFVLRFIEWPQLAFLGRIRDGCHVHERTTAWVLGFFLCK
jgi:hypothetical protein